MMKRRTDVADRVSEGPNAHPSPEAVSKQSARLFLARELMSKISAVASRRLSAHSLFDSQSPAWPHRHVTEAVAPLRGQALEAARVRRERAAAEAEAGSMAGDAQQGSGEALVDATLVQVQGFL